MALSKERIMDLMERGAKAGFTHLLLLGPEGNDIDWCQNGDINASIEENGGANSIYAIYNIKSGNPKIQMAVERPWNT